MTNFKKINEILTLIVTTASAVVALSDIWAKIGPDVKKTLKPVIDGCKRIASTEQQSKPAVIE